MGLDESLLLLGDTSLSGHDFLLVSPSYAITWAARNIPEGW